jgi:hypothetical protein
LDRPVGDKASKSAQRRGDRCALVEFVRQIEIYFLDSESPQAAFYLT